MRTITAPDGRVFDLDAFDELPEELAQLEAIYEANPLAKFLPLSDPQKRIMEARTSVQAAFAGNRFGKTTALVVKSFVQHCPKAILPKHLHPYKLTPENEPIFGRILCPSDKVMLGVIIPALKKWMPKELVRGGSFSRAWDKQHNILNFADGGQIDFFTYKQDAEVLVGAALHYCAYDEPPPEGHRRECLIRLVDHKGFEFFAMTPVNMVGGGIGWIYRNIWKQREAPHITVVQGSIHDNPLLDADTVEQTLSQYPQEERDARESGEFLHFGGMIYPGGFERILVPPPNPEQLKGQDILVGIDPGLRNAAFVWVAIDRDQRAVVFDEQLLQDKTPEDYAKAIRKTNEKWGLTSPLYVIDPSARNRSLTNAESVEAELARLGFYCAHGQNPVEAGVQQVRRRMQNKMLFVSEDCHGLRDEADEYRAEDRPDGEFKPVKENDHRLDALRYACAQRPWGPFGSTHDPEPLDHWIPGTAPSWKQLQQLSKPDPSPLGAMS